MQAQLGRRYRDKVTGFEGIAVSFHDYLQGCRRVSLERLDTGGDKLVTLTFDEPNLEFVDDGIYMTEAEAEAAFKVTIPVRTGGPHDHGSPVDTH
jgi:hypothetical protein